MVLEVEEEGKLHALVHVLGLWVGRFFFWMWFREDQQKIEDWAPFFRGACTRHRQLRVQSPGHGENNDNGACEGPRRVCVQLLRVVPCRQMFGESVVPRSRRGVLPRRTSRSAPLEVEQDPVPAASDERCCREPLRGLLRRLCLQVFPRGGAEREAAR